MQGHSPEFAQIVRKSHTPIARISIQHDGKVTAQIPILGGVVPADRMAAQMRSGDFEIVDPDGTLTPEDMNSELAPFGAQVLIERGVRKSAEETTAAFYGSAASWVPSGVSTGVMNSVKVDTDGSLTLGP